MTFTFERSSKKTSKRALVAEHVSTNRKVPGLNLLCVSLKSSETALHC